MYDVCIIGGGIVGLASAWRLHEMAPELQICILEKEAEVARHQSSHNSGVIHSGVYYRPGSQRALLCREGYDALLRFCEQYGIAHEICGKVIVATREEERPQLDHILDRGLRNGLSGIRKISPEECSEIEPHVAAVEALLVPQAGIINYGKVAQKLADLLANTGQTIQTGSKVVAIQSITGGQILRTGRGEEIRSKLVINCAGLYSDRVAALGAGRIEGVQIVPFRGEYYELIPEKEHLVNHLIYPVPNPQFPFLGVHFTRMIEGGIEAGPSAVLAFRREGYNRWQIHPGELAATIGYEGFRKLARQHWRFGMDELRRSFSKKAFVRALQHLIPEITPADVVRGRAGVRAMAVDRDGVMLDDFLIRENESVIDVGNAPSPAATASLAIGRVIAQKALKNRVKRV